MSVGELIILEAKCVAVDAEGPLTGQQGKVGDLMLGGAVALHWVR